MPSCASRGRSDHQLQGVPNRIGKGRASISATAMATGPAAPLNVPSSSTNAATAPSASAATTVSHATAITVAAGTASASAATAPARTRATSKRVGPGMAANNNSSSSSSNESGRDLTDLVDNAHAVLAAREELAEMLTTVRATREEVGPHFICFETSCCLNPWKCPRCAIAIRVKGVFGCGSHVGGRILNSMDREQVPRQGCRSYIPRVYVR